MHSSYNKANFPYYGQPYHTYYPPAYQQQQPPQPRHAFPASDPYNNSQWPRDHYPGTPYPQSHPDMNPPFIPPNSEPAPRPPQSRPKRANTTTRPTPSNNTEKQQLRSAMKKNPGLRRSDTVGAAQPPLERTRTSSSARQRLLPMTRTGTNSNPNYIPGQSPTP